MNYGLSVNNVLHLAYQYAVQCQVPHPKNWDINQKARKDWYVGFMKRNPTLSLRKATPKTLVRAKGFKLKMATATPAKKLTPPTKKGTVTKRAAPDSKEATLKRKKKISASSEENIDFCMICGDLLDHPMNKNNTVGCDKCQRPFHLRCITMRSYFTCKNCDSDLDVSDEE